MDASRRSQGRPRSGRLLGAAGAVLCTALAAAPAAHGGSTERADFTMRFGARVPSSDTALDLRILYKAPGDREAKPSPIRKLVIDAPPGTRFRGERFPACDASDLELRSRGRRACPPGALVGRGALTVMTGLGSSFDPFPTDVWIYNTPIGFVEVVQQRGQDATLGLDRITVTGSRLSGHPPATPGGPPDGQSAVREIDFTFPADNDGMGAS